MQITDRNEYQYDLFISYRTSGAASKYAAEYLQKIIENLEISPVEKLKVFRDKDQIRSGMLSPQLEQAARSSKKIVILCSEEDDSSSSSYMRKELEAFLSVSNHHIDDIIPILIDGEFRSTVPDPLSKSPELDDLLVYRIDSRRKSVIKRELDQKIFGIASATSGVPRDKLEDREAIRERKAKKKRQRYGLAAASITILLMILLGIESARMQFISGFSDTTGPVATAVFGLYANAPLQAQRGESVSGSSSSYLIPAGDLKDYFLDGQVTDRELLAYACNYLADVEVRESTRGAIAITAPRWRRERSLDLFDDSVFENSWRSGSALSLSGAQIFGDPEVEAGSCGLSIDIDTSLGQIAADYRMSADGFYYSIENVSVPYHLDLDKFRVIGSSKPTTLFVPEGSVVNLNPSVHIIKTVATGYTVASMERANRYLGRKPYADLPLSDLEEAVKSPRKSWKPSFLEYATMGLRRYQMNRAGLGWTYRIQIDPINSSEIQAVGGQIVVDASVKAESHEGYVWRIYPNNPEDGMPSISLSNDLGIAIDMQGRKVLTVMLELVDEELVSNRMAWTIIAVSDEQLSRDIEQSLENSSDMEMDSHFVVVPGLLRNVFPPEIELFVDGRKIRLGLHDDLVIDLRRYHFIPAGNRQIEVFEIPHEYDNYKEKRLVFSDTIEISEEGH